MLKQVIIPDFGPYKFGRLAPKSFSHVHTYSVRKPQMLSGDYKLSSDLIKLAAEKLVPIYSAEEDVLDNDAIGDCTCAGALHGEAITGALSGTYRQPAKADAVWLYTQVTKPPYDPVTGANDQGADCSVVLDYCIAKGSYKDGYGRFKSYSAVNGANKEEVRAALRENFWLYCGACLPNEWINDVSNWGVAGPPVNENGHCFIVYGDNSNGLFVNSWGKFIVMTWDAVAKYLVDSAGGQIFAVSA